MLEGKSLILATKPFAVEDRSKSWMHLLVTLVLMAGVMAAIFYLPNVLVKIAGSIVYALLMVRMFIIYHDYLHHAVLNKSKIASAIMSLFGLYFLTPKSIWKRSHDHHHKHNSKLFSASIGSYPVVTRQKYLAMTSAERFGYLAIRHPLTISLAYFTVFIYGMCVASFLSAPRRHFDSLLALILHVSGAAALIYFASWEAWFFCMFLPFLISNAMGAYLFYAQHNFPGVIFEDNAGWAYELAALESSSYMVMNPVMRWFTGNIGYHHIHHLNSRIPFYRLPETMASIPELQKVKTTSLSPRDIVGCLRLKVWDPERKRMISLKEMRTTMSQSSSITQMAEEVLGKKYLRK